MRADELAAAREDAIDKALLYTFQLSNKDYAKMRTFRSVEAFVEALEQDGFTVTPLQPPDTGEGLLIHPGLDADEERLVWRMVRELVDNHHKRPWTEMTPDEIRHEFIGHVEKLLGSGSWEHAADVANLAAMYADLRAYLAATPSSSPPETAEKETP